MLSVALPPGLHFRDQMYRKIAANQTSRVKNLDNIIFANQVRLVLDAHSPVQKKGGKRCHSPSF